MTIAEINLSLALMIVLLAIIGGTSIIIIAAVVLGRTPKLHRCSQCGWYASNDGTRLDWCPPDFRLGEPVVCDRCMMKNIEHEEWKGKV